VSSQPLLHPALSQPSTHLQTVFHTLILFDVSIAYKSSKQRVGNMNKWIKCFGLFSTWFVLAAFLFACGASNHPNTNNTSKDGTQNTRGARSEKTSAADAGSWGPQEYFGGHDAGSWGSQEYFSGHDAGAAAHEAAPKSWGSNIGTGGAQDIGQFRKIIKDGNIPAPETLDANGFFSEHYTTLPAPTCGQTFCIHGMFARNKSFIGNETYSVLQLGMNSSKDIKSLPRLPLNLVVVIDTSGSMQRQNKLEYVKEGLKLMLDKLQPQDTLAIIRYDSSAHLVRNANPVTASNKQQIIQQIEQLRATGGTNLYEGLELGFKECLKQFSDGKQNRVIFLSDGQASAGITSNELILKMSNSYIKKGMGLTTMGVGTSFNVQLMRSLAEASSGNYYFLESKEAIREVFQDEMDYFVVPIAYDIKISVELGPQYTLAEVFGTNLWQNTSKGGEIHIPSVFLTGRTAHDDPKASSGSGRRGGGSAIMLRLNELLKRSLSPRAIASITLTFRPAGESKEVTQQIKVDFSPTSQNQLSEPYYSHKAIEKNYIMLNIYLGLRNASQLAVQQQDINAALATLNTLKKEVEAWNKLYEDEDIKADLELIDAFRQNLKTKGAKE
tara:strand:+ start:5792 stop:7624 length:1833 start_codon:yes stop_codon:yes gene_type:complete